MHFAEIVALGIPRMLEAIREVHLPKQEFHTERECLRLYSKELSVLKHCKSKKQEILNIIKQYTGPIYLKQQY